MLYGLLRFPLSDAQHPTSGVAVRESAYDADILARTCVALRSLRYSMVTNRTTVLPARMAAGPASQSAMHAAPDRSFSTFPAGHDSGGSFTRGNRTCEQPFRVAHYHRTDGPLTTILPSGRVPSSRKRLSVSRRFSIS